MPCSRREGYNLSEAEVTEAIKLLDKNGDKLIQFSEFVDWWQNEVCSSSVNTSSTITVLLQIFRRFIYPKRTESTCRAFNWVLNLHHESSLSLIRGPT